MVKKTLKVTNSRELNISDIKNNKIQTINKKIITKTTVPKNGGKIKTKLINIKNTENKDSLNNSLTRPKTNNSLNKNINHKKMSNNSVAGNANNNSYSNLNDPNGKRSHSISENAQIKKEEIKNKQYNNNSTTVILNNNNNNNVSPNILKSRKIPFNNQNAKVKNQGYNSNTFEGNLKKETKTEYTYPYNRKK